MAGLISRLKKAGAGLISRLKKTSASFTSRLKKAGASLTSWLKKIKASLTSRLRKMLYLAMPMLEAYDANHIIDKKIDENMIDDSHRYVDFPARVLRVRMKQEHERDRFIDAKTARLGQGILGMLAAFGILFALLPVAGWSGPEKIAGMVFLLVFIFYIVFAWWLTVQANATTEVYGYGTDFELEANRNQYVLARELSCQELANIKKHNINFASICCLRNAFILLISATLVVLVRLVISFL